MGFVWTTVKQTIIRDNTQFSIRMDHKNMKYLLKLREGNSSKKAKLQIKGKIGGDWGDIQQKELLKKKIKKSGSNCGINGVICNIFKCKTKTYK